MDTPKPDDAVMHKETVTKEDGRTLIYYRFEPSAAEAAPVDAATSTEGR